MSVRFALTIDAFLVVALIAALPATFDDVVLMRRYGTPILDVPFHLVYAVFLLFMAAVVVRQAVQLVNNR